MTEKKQNPYLEDNKSNKDTSAPKDTEYKQTKKKFEFGSLTQIFESLKQFSIKGRISRLRYISFTLAIFVAVIVSSFLLLVPVIGNMLLVLIAILAVVSLLWLSLQRCQDFNLPTLLGAVLLIIMPGLSLVLYFIPGTKGENRYGPEPPKNSTAVVVSATLLLFLFGLAALLFIVYPWVNFLSFRKGLW